MSSLFLDEIAPCLIATDRTQSPQSETFSIPQSSQSSSTQDPVWTYVLSVLFRGFIGDTQGHHGYNSLFNEPFWDPFQKKSAPFIDPKEKKVERARLFHFQEESALPREPLKNLLRTRNILHEKILPQSEFYSANISSFDNHFDTSFLECSEGSLVSTFAMPLKNELPDGALPRHHGEQPLGDVVPPHAPTKTITNVTDDLFGTTWDVSGEGLTNWPSTPEHGTIQDHGNTVINSNKASGSIHTPDVNEVHSINLFGGPFNETTVAAEASFENVMKINDEDPLGPKPEVVYEIEVPVVSSDFDSQWQSSILKPEKQFETNPMACFNPIDVEGRELVEKKMKLMLTSSQPSPAKRARKKLPKLIIPPPNVEVSTPTDTEAKDSFNTPAVQNVLDKNAEQSGFDLLEFVTNQELPVDDPDFLKMIEAVTPQPQEDFTTIDLAPLVSSQPKLLPSKGKKKAPAKTHRPRRSKGRGPTAPSTSSDHSYMTNYDASQSQLSSDEVKEVKYRRMRDLNNEASKRCRMNRKRKFNELLSEEDELKNKNAELRKRCQHMEDLVNQLKRQFIEKISNPKLETRKKIAPLDLDALLDERLGSM